MMKQGLKSNDPHVTLKFPTYSFDIYIHHVMNFTPLPLHKLVFGFRLWEFPLVTVGSQSVDFENRNIKFYCGKSCVFSMEEDLVLKKMAVSPLYCYLFTSNDNKGVELVGTSSIDLSDIYLPTQKSPNPYAREKSEDILKNSKFVGRGETSRQTAASKKNPSNVLSVTEPFHSIKGYEVGLYDIDIRIRIITNPSGTEFSEKRERKPKPQSFDMRTQSNSFFGNPNQTTGNGSFVGTTMLGSRIAGLDATSTLGSNNTATMGGMSSNLHNLVENYQQQRQNTDHIRDTLTSTFTNLQNQLQSLRTLMDPNQQRQPNNNNSQTNNSSLMNRRRKTMRKKLKNSQSSSDLYRHQPGTLYPPSRMKKTFLRQSKRKRRERRSRRRSTTSTSSRSRSQKIRNNNLEQLQPQYSAEMESLRKKKQLEQLRARSNFLHQTILESKKRKTYVVSPPSPEWYEKKDHTFHDDLLKNAIELHLQKNGTSWNSNNSNSNQQDQQRLFKNRRTAMTMKNRNKKNTTTTTDREKWKVAHDWPSQIEKRRTLVGEKEKKVLRRKRTMNRKKDARSFLDKRKILHPPEEEFKVIRKPKQFQQQRRNIDRQQQQQRQQPQQSDDDDEYDEYEMKEEDDETTNDIFEDTLKDEKKKEYKVTVEKKKEYKVTVEDKNDEMEETSPLEEKIVGGGEDTMTSTMMSEMDDDDMDVFNSVNVEDESNNQGGFDIGEDDEEEENQELQQQQGEGDDDDIEDMKFDDNEFEIGDEEKKVEDSIDTLLL